MQRYLWRLLRALCAGGLWLALTMVSLAADNAPTPRVLVLGDSISAAYGMSLAQGWVTLLQQRLRLIDSDITVVNASISGDTTSGGLRRLPDLLDVHHPTILVIELGGNDGLRGYPINQLRANLRQMVMLGQRSGAEVLLLPMEIPPSMGPRYTRLFRESFVSVAKETSAHLGPFLLDGVATDAALMQADGIHPTAAAQPRLLDNLWPSISGLVKLADPS